MTPKDKTASQQAAELNKTLGLKFVHVRAITEEGNLSAKGGCTVAYKSRLGHGGRILDVSVAICNDKDVYSRADGRLIAIMNFKKGEHINVRVPKNTSVVGTLNSMFRKTVW